jgi:hypothetical protein
MSWYADYRAVLEAAERHSWIPNKTKIEQRMRVMCFNRVCRTKIDGKREARKEAVDEGCAFLGVGLTG